MGLDRWINCGWLKRTCRLRSVGTVSQRCAPIVIWVRLNPGGNVGAMPYVAVQLGAGLGGGAPTQKVVGELWERLWLPFQVGRKHVAAPRSVYSTPVRINLMRLLRRQSQTHRKSTIRCRVTST